MALTKVTYSMIDGAVANVLDYGADPTGVADSRAACQAAITALQAAGGGTVFFPSGTYLLTPVASSDALSNGLVVPYTSANSSANRIILQGAGRSTILKANDNSMYIVRFSDSHGGVKDLTLDGNGKTSVTGLGCVPEDTTQTSTLVFQNYNVFSGLYVLNCAEGVSMRCGPDVSGSDSGCWYNVLKDTHIYACTRGIWLRNGPNAGCSSVNRNNFFNIRIGQNTNTGLQIDAADTCKFYGVHFESIATGTSPNATPTAVYIAQTSSAGFDNNQNMFFGCEFESNTRDLENYNTKSQFYGCGFRASKVLSSGGAGYGLVCVGGIDASNTPQLFPGNLYQTNLQLSAYPNGTSFIGTSGSAGVSLNSTVFSTTSFEETSGTSGSVANGATFDITVPTIRRPQLLFLYSGFSLNASSLYFIRGDGAATPTATGIVTPAGSPTAAGNGTTDIRVTNNYGGAAVIKWTLTPFGQAIP